MEDFSIAGQLETLLEKGVEVIVNDLDLLSQMLQFHALIFGDSCAGCEKKYRLYFNNLLTELPKLKTMSKKKSKFRFRKDGLYLRVNGEHINQNNIVEHEDKVLKKLKENPNGLKLFEEYPKNWEALADKVIEAEAQAKADAEAEKLKADENPDGQGGAGDGKGGDPDPADGKADENPDGQEPKK